MPISIGMLIVFLIAGGAIGYGLVRCSADSGNWFLLGLGSFAFTYILIAISSDSENYFSSMVSLVSLVSFLVVLFVSPQRD